jgi:guanidinoacetate N-methyltransferase
MSIKPPASNEHVLQELRSMYTEIGFQGKEAWKNAPAVFDGHTLKILDHPVMEDWEIPYMKKLAEIATRNGGAILEIGFGLGISAGFIQKAQISTHTIIEANHDVAERARVFCNQASHPTNVLEGLCEEVIETIADDSLDGILYDAYPLDETEVMNQCRFARVAYRKLKKGGIFTYFSDEIDHYRPDHLAQLIEAGFSGDRIESELVEVAPPSDCLYWKSSTILAPILRK